MFRFVFIIFYMTPSPPPAQSSLTEHLNIPVVVSVESNQRSAVTRNAKTHQQGATAAQIVKLINLSPLHKHCRQFQTGMPL